MPYTYAWDEAAPAGASAANALDTAIQDFKKSLRERFNDVLVTDWSADPVVLKDSIIGKATGLQHVIPFAAFQGADNPTQAMWWNHEISGTSGWINQYTNGSARYVASVNIPAGSTITKIEAVARLNQTAGSNSATVRLRSYAKTVTSGSWTNLDSLACARNLNGLYNLYTSGALTRLLASDTFYIVQLEDYHVANRWVGIILTYDRPSHLVGA